MKQFFACLIIVLLISCSESVADQNESLRTHGLQQDHALFLPTLLYKREIIQEFVVFIHPDVLDKPQSANELRKELNDQLIALSQVIPHEILVNLKRVPIWVEWEARKDNAAEFHVSTVWLKANGYNPDKVRGIEISNTENFIAWSRNGQKWIVLHELSHAYYHSTLEWRWEEIRRAYENAINGGLYESVTHIHGGKRRAYALTSQDEYFAELSEAYFGKNDFFPFTRSELKEYDPTGFQLMLNTWGMPHDAK